VRGRGVYAPRSRTGMNNVEYINRCAGMWGLYTALLIPVRGRVVCPLINKETLLGLMSELRSNALPATTIDFSRIRTQDSLRANRVS